MLSASTEFRKLVAQNTKVLVKATLKLADGTVLNLTGDDLMMGGLSFGESTSSSGSFDVGAAIIGTCELRLNNMDQRLDAYDFTGAEVTPYVGKDMGDGTTEWLRKGRYGVEQPDSYGGVVTLSCYDNMRSFEVPYSEVTTQYPAQLGIIMHDICQECGVGLYSQAFANHSYVVSERPEDDMTCLDMVSYVAQVSGNYAKCDSSGNVRLSWYDTSAFEDELWLDGGTYEGTGTPYPTGQVANGGNFDYGATTAYDSGTFAAKAYAQVSAWTSATIVTDDVLITGVRVTEQDGTDEDGKTVEGTTALSGDEGYVISISDNPLVVYGKAQDVADMVGNRLVGMRFRPFECSALGDPCVEAGDPVVLIDGRQNRYLSYLTSVSYKAGSYETFRCDAETPSRNQAAMGGSKTATEAKMRREVAKERNERMQAVKALSETLAASSGLYMTVETKGDGSKVYYLHDKKTLAGSSIVWKMTAEAIGISMDGGATYPYGLSVDGTAILNKIYAIGLNADYITTGVIRSADGGSFWNLVTGEFQIKNADPAKLVGSVWTEYAVGSSSTTAPTGGWSEGTPTWTEGKYIWARTATKANDTTITYGNPVCIQGAKGKDGADGSDGADGADGTSVNVGTMSIRYAASTSGTTRPSSWQSSIPTVSQGQYLWTRSAITLEDASGSHTSYMYSVAYVGTNGADGTGVQILGSYDTEAQLRAAHPTGNDGDAYIVGGDLYVWAGSDWSNVGRIQGPKGTDGSSRYLHIKYSDDGGSTFTGNAGENPGKYIGTCVDANEADPTDVGSYGWALIKGADGVGISSVTNYYLASSSSSGVTPTTAGWTTSVQTPTKSKPYLWNYESTLYTDSNTKSTTPHIIGHFGADGANGNDGTDGSDGVGISSITERYLATDKSSGVTASTSGWTTTVQTMTETKRYLWNYETVAYTNGSSTSTTPAIIGVYGQRGADGADGADGKDGADGSDGVGISKLTPQYYLSTSSTSATGGSWSTTPQSYVSGRYYWTRTKVDWDDGTVSYTEEVYDRGLTDANAAAASAAAEAEEAKKTATNYMSFSTTNGLVIGNTTYITGQSSQLNGNIQLGLESSKPVIKLRNGTTTLAKFATTGLYLYNSSGQAIAYFERDGVYFNGTTKCKFTTSGISCTGGTIGGFTVGSTYIYNGKSSLTSATSGIYISTSGISVGNGSTWLTMANGRIYGAGGSNTSENGYLSFNNYWNPTGVYGTRVAGKGCVCIFTNGAFGVGSYTSYGYSGTISTGESGTINYISKIQDNGDGTITWWTNTLTFKHGLMNTTL